MLRILIVLRWGRGARKGAGKAKVYTTGRRLETRIYLIAALRRSKLKASYRMARGWESKSVEAQIESSKTDRRASGEKSSAEEPAETRRKRDTLLLARARILEQIRDSQNPRHREMMEKALSDLEKILAQHH